MPGASSPEYNIAQVKTISSTILSICMSSCGLQPSGHMGP